MNRFLPNVPQRRIFLALLSCGLTLRLLSVIFFHAPLISDDIDYQSMAQSIVAGQGFQLEGKSTAYRMPGYPLILAGTYLIFGNSSTWMKLLQVFADIVSCVILFAIGKRVFSERVSFWAMGIALFFPAQILSVSHLMTETIFTTLLLLIIWMVLAGRENEWVRENIILGVLIGIAVLIRATALVVPLAIVFYRHLSGTRLSVNARGFAFMSITIFLVVSPWLVRNYVEFERFAVTSNTGVNFWMGNHDGASGGYSFPTQDNPLAEITDDFERSNFGLKLGFAFIVSHPFDFAVLVCKKFAHFFSTDYWLLMTVEYKPEWRLYPNAASVFAELTPWKVAVVHFPFVVILFLGSYGLIFHGKDGKAAILFLSSVIVLWLLVHLVFYAGARYRFPVVPLIMVFAAYGFHLLRSRISVISGLRVAAFIVLVLTFIGGWVAELWTIQNKKIPEAQLKKYLDESSQTGRRNSLR
ncbi:MAG: glycosyltransferase family 39 protein [Ignavibacteriales bacterium]|nr:glycosyltransferase family 39 protein [Ignavibacteriales bacterium]